MSSKVDRPLSVHVPGPAEDRPSWVKVGVIAAIGFAVGVVWPRVAGIKLGPSAPEGQAASHPAAHASAPAVAQATMAPSAAPPPSAAPSAAPPAAQLPTVTFGHAFVLNCKNKDGEALKGAASCGTMTAFDSIAQPRLKKVAECPAAVGASGKLAVVFGVDFEANRVHVDLGKATTIATPDALLACVRSAFHGVSVAGVDHQQPRYGILYTLAFTPAPGSTPTKNDAPPTKDEPGEATVQVGWEVAIVRDAPKNGQILARLPRGTKLKISAPKEGWYHVKYGTDFSSEGWVYRGAIGK